MHDLSRGASIACLVEGQVRQRASDQFQKQRIEIGCGPDCNAACDLPAIDDNNFLLVGCQFIGQQCPRQSMTMSHLRSADEGDALAIAATSIQSDCERRKKCKVIANTGMSKPLLTPALRSSSEPRTSRRCMQHALEFKRIDRGRALLIVIEKHKYVAPLRIPGFDTLSPSR